MFWQIIYLFITYLELGKNLFLTSSTLCWTSVRKVRAGLSRTIGLGCGGLVGGELGKELRLFKLIVPEELRPPLPYGTGGFAPMHIRLIFFPSSPIALEIISLAVLSCFCLSV